MGCLLDTFDRLAEDEDEDSMDYLRKHYGPLPQISCVYPSYKRPMLPITLLTFAMHSFLLGSHLILLLITVQRSVVDWDLELSSLAVHFAVVLAMGLFFLYYLPFQRELYTSQMKKLVKDIGRYKSGRIYDEDWCVNDLKENKKETIYFLALPAFIGLATGTVLILPYTMKTINGMENPYSSGMVNRNLPIPAWYPFPTHEGVLHWIAVIFQFSTACSVAPIIAQLLLIFLVVSQRIRYELRVVGYSLETLFPRSMKLYLRMNPGKNRAGVNLWDPAYQRVVEMCLIDSVIHHHTIGELISTYAEQVNVTGFFAFASGTVAIGMSLYNILEALNTNSYGTIILFSAMILMETGTMFVLSLLGEAITEESVALRNQLYYSEWHNLDSRNRRILLNFHTAMTEPIVISSMGLINFSLDTFSSIMNTAYSFFNIMNTKRGK